MFEPARVSAGLQPVRTAVVVQSNYIPWKGYFDLIRRADCFVLFDDAQYTVRDWRNRNRIKTKDGVHWLSLPVVHESRGQRIRDTRIADRSWNRQHWKTLADAYARAPYFRTYRAAIEELYAHATSPWLSEINRTFIEAVCGWLNISTPICWSSDFTLVPGQTARLVEICRQVGANRYLSGPSARNYLDVSSFDEAGLSVAFMDYSGYPQYQQLYPPFDHGVTALDLLFNTGPEAPRYLLPL